LATAELDVFTPIESRLNEAISWLVKEHLFDLVERDAMFDCEFVRNLRQLNEIIDEHALKQLKLDRQILLRILGEVVHQLHAFGRKMLTFE